MDRVCAFVSLPSLNCCALVLFRHNFFRTIRGSNKLSMEEEEMIYKAMGSAHALAVSKGEVVRRAAVEKSGQGTVEYVGLILLVSLLMLGMVAAMKGFSGREGTELAELIVDKIQSAVDKIAFR